MTRRTVQLARLRNRHFTERARRRAHSAGMSDEEERTLLGRWRRSGDRRALARLADANRSLVERIASAFTRYGVGRDDLVQEGFVGLMTAIRRFDLGRDSRLADYARPWVRLHMVRFAVASVGPLRVETHRVDVAAAVGRDCHSLDDKRSAPAVAALVDPSPTAEDRLATAEEASARAERLAARLAALSAEERAVIGARHFGERDIFAASPSGANEAERSALAKLLLEPGEPGAGVHVLIGGRRRRLDEHRTERRQPAVAR